MYTACPKWRGRYTKFKYSNTYCACKKEEIVKKLCLFSMIGMAMNILVVYLLADFIIGLFRKYCWRKYLRLKTVSKHRQRIFFDFTENLLEMYCTYIHKCKYSVVRAIYNERNLTIYNEPTRFHLHFGHRCFQFSITKLGPYHMHTNLEIGIFLSCINMKLNWYATVCAGVRKHGVVWNCKFAELEFLKRTLCDKASERKALKFGSVKRELTINFMSIPKLCTNFVIYL